MTPMSLGKLFAFSRKLLLGKVLSSGIVSHSMVLTPHTPVSCRIAPKREVSCLRTSAHHRLVSNLLKPLLAEI